MSIEQRYVSLKVDYEMINTIVWSFFRKKAEKSLLTDCAEAYEALGKIKEILDNPSSPTTATRDE